MRLSDIDLRLLRVFEAVAKAGGFKRAQDTLGISQPAISAYIAKLEDRLGVRLCDRGPQGFSLTAHGENVLAEAQQLLDLIERSSERLANIGKEPSKQLRFGVVDCLVTDPANPLIAKLRVLKSKDRTVKFQFGVYDFLECLTELRGGRLDIAIVGVAEGETIPDDLEALHLYEETSGLFCAPDHPCSGVQDIDHLRELLLEAEISAHSFLSNPIDQDLDLDLMDRNAEVAQDNIESTVYLTLTGSHVGLIPLHFAQLWVQTGALVPIAPEVHQVLTQFHAVRYKAALPAPACDAFWKILNTP